MKKSTHIKIDVEKGCIVGFSGVPKGTVITVNDYDNKKLGEKWQERYYF